MRRFLAAAALVVGLGAPCLAAGASTNPFGNDSPGKILSLAQAAMDKAGSMHIAITQKLGKLLTITETEDCAAKVADQSIRANKGVGAARITGGHLYLQGNKVFYNLEFTDPSSPLVGKWAEIKSSLGVYSSIASGMLLSSAVPSVLQLSKPVDLGLTSFEGHSAVAVKGKLTYDTGGLTVIQTVYVSTGSSPLPLGTTATISDGSVKGTATIVLTKYGEKLNVVQPSHYVVAAEKDF